ncbi:MAG: OmpA/MotB family protein, partial [Phycisphaeraceae bacterium]
IKTPVVLLLLVVGLASVGCQRSIDERNALMDQNREAQAEINRLRLANDSLMNDLAAANAEISRLLAENASLRAARPATPAANQPRDTGFEGIDDVTSERSGNLVTVRVASDILFASGKVDLKSTAKRTLADVSSVLQSQYAGKTIRVEGYTDTDPIRKSGWKDNLELSLQRSAAVHRYLQQQGIDAERMYAAGFGATNTLGSKAASRRVEIVVVLSE